MKRTKVDLLKNWIKKANRDLEVAKREIDEFTDIACFHAQQACEKYIKAYLIWLDIEYPKTHAIEKLIELASEKDAEILCLREKGAEVTDYAINTRYPEFEEPLLEDAKKAVEIAAQIRQFILERLPNEIVKEQA